MAVFFYHGTWVVEIWRKGKKVYRETGFKTQLDAKVAERNYKEELPTSTDFIELCTKHSERLEEMRSKDHFRASKKVCTELIKRYQGKTPTTDQIEEYLKDVAKMSNKLANRRLVLIRALFNFGIKKKLVKTNPTDGIEKRPVKEVDRYIPSQDDIRLVLETATCEERWFLLVLAHTMGRPRSVLKLKWSDIHQDHLVLRTRKARNSDEKIIRVPINEVLREVLKLISKQGEYVFMNPRTGTHYKYRRRIMHTLCYWAGVDYFPFYSLRHFGASKLDNLGVPLTDIQEILGHSLPTTTNHYLQSLRGSASRSIRKLEDLLI